jgi:hypothetical protein
LSAAVTYSATPHWSSGTRPVSPSVIDGVGRPIGTEMQTTGLILEPLRHVGRAANFTAVFFRRTMPQITNPGALWDESSKFYPRLGGTPHLRLREWRWPRGGKIKSSHICNSRPRFMSGRVRRLR